MNAAKGYAAYANSKVLTASPAELTLMLYDGAIRFANVAIAGIKEGDIQKAHTNIRKCDAIIENFIITLDPKYEVAKDFQNVYEYIRERLAWANVKKDAEIMEEVLTHLHTLRDTWKEVMKKTNNGNSVA
jgi:flagellar protein FliS